MQRSLAQTLEAYGKLYDRQSEQLKKLQEDVTRVHNLVYQLYILPYPPTAAEDESDSECSSDHRLTQRDTEFIVHVHDDHRG